MAFVVVVRWQEFEMDFEIIEQLKQHRQDTLDALSHQLAWEEEKCRITLHKVHTRFVRFLLHTVEIYQIMM